MTMGGKNWIVPALNFKQIREFLPKLKAIAAVPDIGGIPSEKNMTVSSGLILAALKRNYPTLTENDVEEMLDLNNVGSLTLAVMGQSGLVVSGDDMGEQPGEQEKLIGAGSIPTS